MSIGSVKPGGVWAAASGCNGGGDCDNDGLSWVLNTPGNAVVDDVEPNHACRAAGLLRDSNSKLHQHTGPLISE